MEYTSGKLKAAWPAVAFLAAAGLIVSRRPDSIFNPQFWAEDGAVWYAQAYNNGILQALMTPEAGYFQTFSRMAAALSLVFPLELAPLVFNIIAIAVQSVVAAFIISDRSSRLVPKPAWRVLLAFLYVALPHSWEVHANVTNSQWHLALLSFLVIAAKPGAGPAWNTFDLAAVLMSALSGPLCIFLLPLAGWKYYLRREKPLRTIMIIVAFGAVIQILSLLTQPRPTQAALGADAWLFMKITFRHIAATPIIGQGGFHLIWERFGWNEYLVLGVNSFAAGVAVYAFVKGTLELRMLIIFSVMIYAAALISPAASPADGQWIAISEHNTSLRYWFIPGFCVVSVLVFLVAWPSSQSAARYVAASVLLLMPFGLVKDWSDPKFEDKQFQLHAAAFEAASPGAVVNIPINPDWEMRLVKKRK